MDHFTSFGAQHYVYGEYPIYGEYLVRNTVQLRKAVYRILGIIFTVVGVVGIVLPVIPTTGPLILASGFFIHSSPRLHRWLNGNRITGPYIRAYTEKRGLSLRRKLGTIAFLWFGLSVSGYIMRDSSWVLLLLAAVGVGVSIHVATIRPEVPFGMENQRSAEPNVVEPDDLVGTSDNLPEKMTERPIENPPECTEDEQPGSEGKELA